jgi:hypothetical protein
MRRKEYLIVKKHPVSLGFVVADILVGCTCEYTMIRCRFISCTAAEHPPAKLGPTLAYF